MLLIQIKNGDDLMKESQKINLVLIDDEIDFLTLTDVFLRKINPAYDIKKFQSPKECLNFIKTENNGTDIIISDYEMPEMNGLELLREIKRILNVPFIMVSGKAREEIIIEALNQGVDFYIQKSVTAESMYMELDNLIKTAFEKLSIGNELSELKNFYEALVNLSPEGIIIHVNGPIIYANPALLEMLQYTDENDLLGKSLFDAIIHPDYHKKVKNRIKMSLAGTKTPFILVKFMRSDGTTLDVSATGRPIKYRGKQALIVFVRDLTETAK